MDERNGLFKEMKKLSFLIMKKKSKKKIKELFKSVRTKLKKRSFVTKLSNFSKDLEKIINFYETNNLLIVFY